MRRFVSLGLTVLGLAIAVPCVAEAGPCPTCDAINQGNRGLLGRPSKSRHLCPKCQLDAALRESGSNPVVIHNAAGPDMLPPGVSGMNGMQGMPGACAACEASAPSGEPAGYAALGTGGTIISTEPTPIGLMRAGFQPQAGPVPATAASPMGMAGHPTLIPAAPTGWQPRRSHRTSVIAHLFGLDGFGQWRADRAEARASQHARLPLGSTPGTGPVTDVPASAVYGR